jgi:hypothetical protein
MDYSGEKYEYCLVVSGPMFDTPEIVAEGLAAGKHYFDTIAQLWYFFAELQILRHKHKTPPLSHEIREGRSVRYYTAVTLLYLHDFVTYEIEYKFDFLSDHDLVKHFVTQQYGGISCDCSRSKLIRMSNPDFPKLEHGFTIELLNYKIEDKK